MRQYEVRWADLPGPAGSRPVLLLTRTEALTYLSRVLVAEITTTIRAIPQEVPLGRREGLERRCVANLENLHALPKRLLRERVGQIWPDRVPEVKRALGFVLDWPELRTP